MPIFVSLRPQYRNPGLGSSEGLPDEDYPGIMHGGAHACLTGVVLADDLHTVGDSDSLGFSARRLARITSWFEAQSEKALAYEFGVSEVTIKEHISAIPAETGRRETDPGVIAAAKISGGQWRPSA